MSPGTQGYGGRSNGTQALDVSPGSLTLIGSTRKRLCLPKDPESDMKTCRHLAVTSCNNNFKIPAQGASVQFSSVAQSVQPHVWQHTRFP